MIHNRYLRSVALAAATVLLLSGPAMAAGLFEPHVAQTQSTPTHVQSANLCSEVCLSGLAVRHVAVGATPSPTLCSEVCDSARAGTHVGIDRPLAAVSSHGNSFDWGDAAIGAGAAIVLMLVIAVGVRHTVNRRTHPRLAKAA